MISLNYDVNDHVYSKSIYLCTDLANIEVIRILAWTDYEIKQIFIWSKHVH